MISTAMMIYTPFASTGSYIFATGACFIVFLAESTTTATCLLIATIFESASQITTSISIRPPRITELSMRQYSHSHPPLGGSALMSSDSDSVGYQCSRFD